MKTIDEVLTEHGVRIQANYGGRWEDVRFADIAFGYALRIKPTPVPPGDLTWDEARALNDGGVTVQFYSTAFGRWEDVIGALEYRNKEWCIRERTAFRRKPEPERVPLGPEDVPLGAWFQQRPQSYTIKQAMLTVEKGYVYLACRMGVQQRSFIDLMVQDWTFSVDGGKTWAPCWKEVE